VLGVDRKKSTNWHAMNWVIDDFSKISADEIVYFFADPARAA
jgi:hypothetical protein